MRYYFLILFGSIVACAVGQEFHFKIRAVYRLTYQSNIHDIQSMQHLDMELLSGDRISLFQPLKQRQKDSVLFYHNKEDAEVYSKVGGIAMRPVSKFSYKILKSGDDVEVFDSAFGMNVDGKEIIYHYKESLSDQDWTIMEDTTQIQGIVCQRADLSYGGRDWTAWFAPEIPMSDGPYKFGGLPGLIFRIIDSTGTWSFELSKLENTDVKHAINFQKWYLIETKKKADLFRDRYEFQQNLPVLSRNVGRGNLTEQEAEDTQKRLSTSLENDNNWIEIYP